MFNLGPGEIIIILVLALLVFGPKRLPDIGRQLGNAMREIKKASNDLMGAFHDVDRYEPEKEPPGVSTPTSFNPTPSPVAPQSAPGAAIEDMKG